MKKSFLATFLFLAAVAAVAVWWQSRPNQSQANLSWPSQDSSSLLNATSQLHHPLSITALRAGTYPGSPITIVETLPNGSNYKRYVVSYLSEGHTIYALMTVPTGPKPASGWPVVVFNHGYIPPQEYRTTERYIAYTDAFSRNGYILFRSDYRGHGNSEGVAEGGYGSNAYTIDILNAVASLKQHPDVDAQRIGMWGHSMGGHITLRAMVVNPDIKAGVIWAGVVASYDDLLNNWRRRMGEATPTPAGTTSASGTRRWRQLLQDQFGTPAQNPDFWNSLSAHGFLNDMAGPIQLHHGTADSSVPVEFSQKLEQQLQAVGKPVELYVYQGDDHNLSRNFSSAMNRSVDFFDQHVKGTSSTSR